MIKQYSVAVVNGFTYQHPTNHQHHSPSNFNLTQGAPKERRSAMQVWQTVSSSRQRARNAERITKKPRGGSEPGAVLVDVGSVPLECGYKNNKPFPRQPFLCF